LTSARLTRAEYTIKKTANLKRLTVLGIASGIAAKEFSP
jgi:hypothetical protein